jgi:hypothetical protein
MRKALWLLAALILVLSIFPMASEAAPLMNFSWRAEYYDNPTLSGQPQLVRFEDAVKNDWGDGSPVPQVSKDKFSARYTVTRHFDKGTYLFVLNVDDGARVWLNGELIIDAWARGPQHNVKVEKFLEKSGQYEVQVAYYEDTGKAFIDFSWLLMASGSDDVRSWLGQYYNNRNLEGEPVQVQRDSQIAFDWDHGSPSPKLPRDNFSVRWTRTVYLEKGNYLLEIQHDDGMRIWVDDKLIHDSWQDQSISFDTRTIQLETGLHDFKVEYYEHLENSVAVMRIRGTGEGGDDDDNGGTPTGEVVVDNTSPGFEWDGPLSNRYVACGGSCYGSNFYWTYNSQSNPVNSGKWTPQLGAGDYEVYVFIPGQCATTLSARYRIFHNGDRHDQILSQERYYNQWVSLGTYYFNGKGQEYVILYDNTNESSGNTQVAFDAIKFVKR